MRRFWRLAGLLLALLYAQLMLAAHGIEHAFHDHDEACIECLALPGFAAVPAQPPMLPAPQAAPAILASAAPPAPSFARHLSFHSRAPPPLPSR